MSSLKAIVDYGMMPAECCHLCAEYSEREVCNPLFHGTRMKCKIVGDLYDDHGKCNEWKPSHIYKARLENYERFRKEHVSDDSHGEK